MAESRVVRVARHDVQKYKDRGYRVKEDKSSSDGVSHRGDLVEMLISEKDYEAHRALVREPFERVRERIEAGISPVNPGIDDAGAEFTFTKQKKRVATGGNHGN